MNFLQRIWKKRWLRRLTWTGVTLVTLYALLCAWVNWSGARKWRATVAMLKAEGETLDFRETLYEPIPESENFCAIPLLKDLLFYSDKDEDKGAAGVNRKRLDALVFKNKDTPGFTNATSGIRADLKKWADFMRKDDSLLMPPDSGNAARDVLIALSKHDPIVHELAAGLDRPYARWTPEWKNRELPPVPLFAERPRCFAMMRSGWYQTLVLRSIAAARAGDAAKAHQAALIIARLNEAFLNEPDHVSLFVASLATDYFLHGVTLEICAAHTGTAEDFTRLESALSALNFQRAELHSVRWEMAAGASTVRGMKTWRENHSILQMFKRNGEQPSKLGDILIRLLPGGVFDSNAAVLAELEYRHMIKPLKEQGWQQAMLSGKSLEKELFVARKSKWSHLSSIMTTYLAQNGPQYIYDYIYDCIYAQVLVNQARIACALERQRIAHGSYPDSLDAVRFADGKPLPPDPMDGKPMRYRKTTDGRYVLWSIGPDGKDDGGKRILHNNDREHTSYFTFPSYIGDLVWDFTESVK